jgi:hypothetical protein
MKRTKLILVRSGGVGVSRKATRSHHRRDGKKRPLLEGLSVDFGGINEGQAPPIDAMIMPALNAALAPISEEFPEACVQRRLLPAVVLNHLVRARFLSFFLLPARSAQEGTGVRASILLADAVHTSADWADQCVGNSNDVFKTGQRFANIYEAFYERAWRLKKNRRFRAVMRAMCDPAECLKQLGRCKLWDELGRRDRVSTILYDCLQECDVLPDKRA